MDRFVILAGVFGIRSHAAFSDDDLHTGLFHEFFLEFFHTHTGSWPDGYHLEFVVFQRTDDRSCMENGCVSHINRKFSSGFHQSSVCNVSALTATPIADGCLAVLSM